MPLPLGHAHSAIIKLSCGIEVYKLINSYAQSENQIKQGKYVPPEITVLEITLEKGFATSSASGTEDWGSLTW